MAGIADEIIEKDGLVIVKRRESAPESLCAFIGALILITGLGICAFLLFRVISDGVALDQQYGAGARFSRGDYIVGSVAAVFWALMGSLPFLALAQVLKYQRVQVALLARILETQHLQP